MNIYFVCTGNTCRSPMAEAILTSKKIDGWYVRSAGIFGMDGGDISENAKAVLKEKGIFYEQQSSSVKEEDLDWADLVLTMTTAHKMMLINLYPQHESKIFTLKEYTAPYAGKDISDPFGGDYVQYEQTFTELDFYISKLEEKIKQRIGGE